VGPNNLDQSIPSMDIIFLVAKICHNTSLLLLVQITMDKVFKSLSLAMGWSKLSPTNLPVLWEQSADWSQPISEWHVSKLYQNARPWKPIKLNSQNKTSRLVEFKPYFNIICKLYCTNFKVGNLKSRFSKSHNQKSSLLLLLLLLLLSQIIVTINSNFHDYKSHKFRCRFVVQHKPLIEQKVSFST